MAGVTSESFWNARGPLRERGLYFVSLGHVGRLVSIRGNVGLLLFLLRVWVELWWSHVRCFYSRIRCGRLSLAYRWTGIRQAPNRSRKALKRDRKTLRVRTQNDCQRRSRKYPISGLYSACNEITSVSVHNSNRDPNQGVHAWAFLPHLQ